MAVCLLGCLIVWFVDFFGLVLGSCACKVVFVAACCFRIDYD